MNPEWVVTGIILFGGMAAAGLSLYLKRRKESQISTPFYDIKTDLGESDKGNK